MSENTIYKSIFYTPRIPSGEHMTELDYIGVGTTSGPYFDTLYAWTSNHIKYDVEFMLTGTSSAGTSLFGSKFLSSNDGWDIQFVFQSDGTITHSIGTSANVYTWTPVQNHKYHFVGEAFDDYTWKITIDGVEYTGVWSGSIGLGGSSRETVGFFTMPGGASLASKATNNVNVYSFKMYNDNELVFNFVPCYYDDLESACGYDSVGEEFIYNWGEGDFVAGPAAATEQKILQRIIYQDPILPTGYTELKYIRSSGAQYLNTLYKPTANTKVVFKAKFASSGNEETGIIGTPSTDTGLFIDLNHWEAYVNSPENPADFDAEEVITNDQIQVFELSGDTLKVNGTTYYTYEVVQNNNNILINSNDGTRMATADWYYVNIYNNNNLVRHFVPCLKTDERAVGMYETFTGNFFYNQGTRAFGQGAVVDYSKTIYKEVLYT